VNVAAIIEAGMEAIAAIIHSIESAKAGTPIDPTAINAALAQLQSALAANNAAADAALAAKFPGTP
jgi:hypothetical protein